jgi:hypothetical protein
MKTDDLRDPLEDNPCPAAKPWELPEDRITIIESHEAEVIGEDGDDYIIKFPDVDGKPIEGNLPKTDFENLPHSVRVGTNFSLVAFVEKGLPGFDEKTWRLPPGASRISKASVWPLVRHWHSSLRTNHDNGTNSDSLAACDYDVRIN